MREATAPPAGRVSRGWISKGYSQPRGPPVATLPAISALHSVCLTSLLYGVRKMLDPGHILGAEAATVHDAPRDFPSHHRVSSDAGAMPHPHKMQRSAFYKFFAKEAFTGRWGAEAGWLTGPGVGGVEEEDKGQGVPAQPGWRRHHLRQGDRDHDQRHQHLEARPAARAPQQPHMRMQRRTAASQHSTDLCICQSHHLREPGPEWSV